MVAARHLARHRPPVPPPLPAPTLTLASLVAAPPCAAISTDSTCSRSRAGAPTLALSYGALASSCSSARTAWAARGVSASPPLRARARSHGDRTASWRWWGASSSTSWTWQAPDRPPPRTTPTRRRQPVRRRSRGSSKRRVSKSARGGITRSSRPLLARHTPGHTPRRTRTRRVRLGVQLTPRLPPNWCAAAPVGAAKANEPARVGAACRGSSR